MEIWKPVTGYEGLYEVSNLGKVKSLNYKRSLKEKIMKGSIGKYGHKNVILSLNGIEWGVSISRIVAINFIPNPLNLPCVCHKDETLDENGLLYNGEDNLFWGTHKENMQDRNNKGRANNHFKLNNPRTNKGKFGKDNPKSKPVNQYTKDGTFIKTWDSPTVVNREIGLCKSNIRFCCIGKRNHVGGFIWKYA